MVLDRMRLDGKRALVTGGSQGLGLGIALGLAEAGADVALVARRRERLADAAGQIESLGRRALALPADLRDLDAAVATVDQVVEAWGGIDILVTAAGAQIRKPALEMTPDDWEHLVAVNLRAVYFMCQRVARYMIAREQPSGSARGKIINIASLTSVGAWPNVSIYGTTKGGVVQMTKAMALEWAQLGICVNAIGPGSFPTELTEPVYSDPVRTARIVERVPMGRPGAPEDLAGAAVFLASSASDYITGQVLYVDGGWLVS